MDLFDYIELNRKIFNAEPKYQKLVTPQVIGAGLYEFKIDLKNYTNTFLFIEAIVNSDCLLPREANFLYDPEDKTILSKLVFTNGNSTTCDSLRLIFEYRFNGYNYNKNVDIKGFPFIQLDQIVKSISNRVPEKISKITITGLNSASTSVVALPVAPRVYLLQYPENIKLW